jgi:hypothetical protein
MADEFTSFEGFFNMPQICDRGPTALLPSEDFFDLKYPTASAGFEPANSGTRGQHVNP